jgi:hypothetical protein
MATNMRSWGILGNPSKEKIEQYKNMPVGSFRNMVKNLSRTKKGKVLQEFTVYVSKRDVDMTRGTIKVEAFEWADAVQIARERSDQVAWDTDPYATNKEEYVYSNMDPLKYKV